MGQSISNKILDPFGFGRTGYEQASPSFNPIPEDLKGLRVAITGANSGLGFAAASQLAKHGAKVLMLCRDKGRGEQAMKEIQGDVSLYLVDMSSYESIQQLEIPEVDVLVHNAGAMFDKREYIQWPQGPLEQTFALHVAGPFLLSKKVKTKETIWVASGGMYSQKLNTLHTHSPPDNPFDGMVAYARCKRAQVTLARRLGHYSMHPGWVDTPGLVTAMPKFYNRTKSILRTIDQGADTIVWLAATQPVQHGFYFERQVVTEYKMPFTKHKDEEEERLMEYMQKITE
ncbi:hypothetical protein FGO68_gene7543 [Halteria grandinella]|uniref:SDR family NAD(P)-dependent oxidoreductase n=1 Tax=Halteria grandinella TaxID=5974 RepID=A0A8J8NKT0_HALGN|nr:hypothetical protein FGO68_gene7543 [Halteria grandinella]